MWFQAEVLKLQVCFRAACWGQSWARYCDLRDLSTPQRTGSLRNTFLTPQEADKPDRKRKPPMDYLSWSFQGGVSLVFCVSLICCGVEKLSYEKLISLISDPTLTFSCFRIEILHNAEFSGDVVIEVMVRVLCSGLSHFTGTHIQTLLYAVQIIFYNITIVCFQAWMNV